MKKIFRSKIFWTLVFVIAIIRLAAPVFILHQLNAFLKDFSPLYAGHIADIHLGVIRGAYQARDFQLYLKEKPEEPFAKIQTLDVSLAWRDLLRGRITTDVVIGNATFLLTDDVIHVAQKSSEQTKEDSKKAKNKILPLDLERVDVRDSSLHLADIASLPESSRFRLNHIQVRATHLTATSEMPLTLVSAQASLFDSAPVRIVATANTLAQPMAWDLDAEIHDFHLANANPWLVRKLPMTFTSGSLDAYSEVRSENGRIEGYVKPFMHKAVIIAKDETFLGLKHFSIEATTSAINAILRDAREKTVASKVLFAYHDGKFEINEAEALSKAIKNGFSDKIPEGLDNEISLSEKYRKPLSAKEKP